MLVAFVSSIVPLTLTLTLALALALALPLPLTVTVSHSHSHSHSPGFEAQRALGVCEYPGEWRVSLRLVTDRNQAKSVRGPAVRGYVSALNFGR